MNCPSDTPPDVPVKKVKKNKKTGLPPVRTKDSHPKLANRLPREKGGLIARVGDGLTLFERALAKLGNRVKQTKWAYFLDGKPCNATEIMRIAQVMS